MRRAIAFVTAAGALGIVAASAFANDGLPEIDAETVLARAHTHARRTMYDAALAGYHDVIDRFPASQQTPKALLAAARLHDRLKQRVEAGRLYRRLITEYPQHDRLDEAVFHLGWTSRESGDIAAAITAWRRVHTDFPDSPYWPEATYLLADGTHRGGEFEAAKKLVDAWLAKADRLGAEVDRPVTEPGQSPRTAHELLGRVLYLRAEIAIDQQVWAEVVPPLTRLVKQIPESSLRLPSQFWIAEAWFRLGHDRKATMHLEELARLVVGRDEPWTAMIPLRRAQLYARAGKWPEAYALAKSLVDEHPDFLLRFEADYVIGRCCASLGEMDLAREAYRRVIESHEGRSNETAAMAQWMIGESFMHQQDYVAALATYRQAALDSAFPEWQARAALQAGVCYERLHRWSDAAAWYVEAATDFRDTGSAGHLAARRDHAQRRTGRSVPSRVRVATGTADTKPETLE